MRVPESATRRRASPLTVLGVLMLVLGLGCLGWVAFQYFGTNVISERAFDSGRTELRTQWAQPVEAQDPERDATRVGSSTASTVPGDAIALLRVPAFGADFEVPVLNGTDLSFLDRGVGHYASTAAAGEVGNFALAGHRVTHGEPFAQLLTLDKGDEVVVETREAIYTYVIDEPPRQLTVQESDTWVLDPVPGHPGEQPTQALITLTTCQDLFRSADRSVGFGHLTSTRNK